MLIVALLACAAGALAEEGAARPVETMEIRGIVVDEDGSPVAGARIWAGFSDRNVETKTDAGGRFAFDLPKQSVYFRVVAGDGGERMGLAEWRKDRIRKSQPDEMRIELGPTQTLELSVTDVDGKPVAGGADRFGRPLGRLAARRDRRDRQVTPAVADRLEL